MLEISGTCGHFGFVHAGDSHVHLACRISGVYPIGGLGKKPHHERLDYSVVFTTPYVAGKLKDKQTFSRMTEQDWVAYFERNLDQTGFDDQELAYGFLMKYGLSRNYWNEYIFLAYLNHQPDMIFLAGFPDMPSSLPHSKEGEARFGF
jgi:hypothetical protein